jgi:hypothetical protein
VVGKRKQSGAPLGRSGSLTREAQPEGRTHCPAGAAHRGPRGRGKAGLKKDLDAPAAMPIGPQDGDRGRAERRLTFTSFAHYTAPVAFQS